jgi:DNA-dependent RNA polymerase auxiliary subunit epsilon
MSTITEKDLRIQFKRETGKQIPDIENQIVLYNQPETKSELREAVSELNATIANVKDYVEWLQEKLLAYENRKVSD